MFLLVISVIHTNNILKIQKGLLSGKVVGHKRHKSPSLKGVRLKGHVEFIQIFLGFYSRLAFLEIEIWNKNQEIFV